MTSDAYAHESSKIIEEIINNKKKEWILATPFSIVSCILLSC